MKQNLKSKKFQNPKAQSPKKLDNFQNLNSEKAYKLLAIQKNISNNLAKELIDKGLVRANGKRVNIAREMLAKNTEFEILQIPKPKILFKDENLLALDKPPFIESYDLAEQFKGENWVLLNRLDIETSGVILLVQENSPFQEKAKQAFKKQQVYKEYRALVSGIVADSQVISAPLIILKNGNKARAKIAKKSDRNALVAITQIEPLEIIGKKTLLKIIIKTGRTHQIRAHLAHIKHAILGDSAYGGAPNTKSNRILLHALKIKLFDYEINSELPKEFLS